MYFLCGYFYDDFFCLISIFHGVVRYAFCIVAMATPLCSAREHHLKTFFHHAVFIIKKKNNN